MYRVSYEYRDRSGRWETAIASFDYISDSTAPSELARRHDVGEADIRVKRIDRYDSMSDLNDLLRG